MTIVIALIIAILALWLVAAIYCRIRLGLSLHQAMLYAPLKFFFRIGDGAIVTAHAAEPPVIYAVWHRSRLEPALMLAILPNDTLHILDEASANAWWLDPWRALARTIAFNARHIFVSRRLVRRLRGKGRLAVYLPDNEAPDAKAFRLFRAIARIAAAAEARVVPIHVEGSVRSFFSLAPDGGRQLLPRLTVATLAPLTIAEMVALADTEGKPMAANALFDRMLAVRRAAPETTKDPELA
ncbi:2-acyl-glycerophospho-ethanolamine acyltransferase [Chelativorans salis]|uniref:2-acyl-glycerophospho-ethanolamine acyltransferase n=1 Tax=Chelativorans salis TaxID=2978478 RepID=A0ABT2LN07_9HYPH|nr:2-acyl-glycerophospho-ethanolamine acyltransferase [Chelativorans sp. EGI FJ00035]MCT7375955.1 2-acyl-glycerophospho-ethanolamine acyltransferase [Chelativorans sp. EGI FJ00035]